MLSKLEVAASQEVSILFHDEHAILLGSEVAETLPDAIKLVTDDERANEAEADEIEADEKDEMAELREEMAELIAVVLAGVPAPIQGAVGNADPPRLE